MVNGCSGRSVHGLVRDTVTIPVDQKSKTSPASYDHVVVRLKCKGLGDGRLSDGRAADAGSHFMTNGDIKRSNFAGDDRVAIGVADLVSIDAHAPRAIVFGTKCPARPPTRCMWQCGGSRLLPHPLQPVSPRIDWRPDRSQSQSVSSIDATLIPL